MYRTVNLLLMAGTSVVFAFWLMELSEGCETLMFPEVRRHGDLVNQLHRQHSEFVPYFHGVLDEVARGHLSLRDASVRLQREALTRFPTYLEFTNNVFDEGDIETKVARNVLNYFEGNVQDFFPQVDLRICVRLQKEYAQMTSRDHQGAGSNPAP